MTKKKKDPPKCEDCEKVLKWPKWTGKPERPVEIKDGSKHICQGPPTALEEDTYTDEDFERDLETSQSMDSSLPEHQDDKLPVVESSKMIVKKIIIERTVSYSYGIAKKNYGDGPEESVFDSLKLGFEIETETANAQQLENITKDYVSIVDFMIREEHTKKHPLRLIEK